MGSRCRIHGGVAKVDQRGLVNQSRTAARAARTPHAPHAPHAAEPWLSGREAAELLGVKRATLYAYASRGLIRSERTEGSVGHRYRGEDLLRLKARSDARAGHGAVAAGALRWGEPVLSSALTSIDARGPAYRGHRAIDLAQRCTFEAVAELLWSGTLPEAPPVWPREGLGVRASQLAALLPANAHPLMTLSLAVPALAAVDPAPLDVGAEAVTRKAKTLILRMAALLGLGRDRIDRARAAAHAGGVAESALVALGATPTKRSVRVINQLLVLLADHELNVSTFTVRIAASAEASLFACGSAGLASLSGGLHGGVCDRRDQGVAGGVARVAIARRGVAEGQ